ncbi:cupin 2 domain-containing protein [Nitrosomonas sp. PY1]|uniref:cupin domain-containing protein n=1 Tax=Nitrosomonas sp. PY1 TaxID=1803906 RepID=UPI001FC7EE22|nr:cupin domain-containing protein [Nitrosomonas sp. PY1]GKS69401.1 cupin 2 domain-containing protein [Nitrosomonas sp. PY1]
MKVNNIFSNIPVVQQEELFEVLIRNDAIRIERIISASQTYQPSDDWYDQEKDEWVIVLKGRAALSFENQPTIHLDEGDYINIPAHVRHKVSWVDPNNKTIWLAIHY